MNKESTFIEKVSLLALAGASIIALTWIALMALHTGTLDPNASSLLGVIVTGLIAFGKDIVSAIRAYSMSAQLTKVTDQLAASVPSTEQNAVQSVEVVNAQDNPVPTTEGNAP